MGSPPILELCDVTKKFAAEAALAEVSLAVEAGEFFAVLGPSGCGKTTLLRLIAGFDHPTSGRIRIAGEDATALPPHRRNVNTVFQQYALFPHLTVFENIAFGLRIRKESTAAVQRRVGEMLEVIRLDGLESRLPSQLSGGQRQRVALARALVNSPRVLLLDEPLSALDRNLRAAMQVELKTIQRALGISFVFVTHDQGEALAMSDRVAIFEGGRLQQLDRPEVLYHSPLSAFVASFLGEANLLPVRIESRSAGQAVVGLEDGTSTVAPLSPLCIPSVDQGLLMVRPEALALQRTAPTPQQSGVQASIRQRTFQGAVIRYELQTPAATPLVAHLPARLDETSFDPGSKVWACWTPGDARLLPQPHGHRKDVDSSPSRASIEGSWR